MGEPAGGSFIRIPKATFRAHIVDNLRSAILAGEIAPGAQVTESSLAEQFGVSRGPLREAMRQLIDEGLLVTIPYTGTRVVKLSVGDIHEIYSMRVNLEIFAFELVWDKRDDAFRKGLLSRHAELTACIDSGNDIASIDAELRLHGFVYEASDHKILQKMWESIRGRLQLYWAAHHRAHGIRGPRRDGHDSYVESALGQNLEAMRDEIRAHMARGRQQTEDFLLSLTASKQARSGSPT